jgi:hypothetical protein
MERFFNFFSNFTRSTDDTTSAKKLIARNAIDIAIGKQLMAAHLNLLKRHMDGDITDREFGQNCFYLQQIGYDPSSQAFREAEEQQSDDEFAELERDLGIKRKGV